ncbi:TetR/AcrR family transcriptional regulator [Sinomonas notoginsengisoli]|uniref:TetR/AcrR family transcriptional regulator n=1 Tax=Sinomonas notoginsengisoli TaxID=1457311 RepID=UPI001F1DE1E9|nr:TetR/AcrR family transcriptional regulator [Sinomonas notoginsengisoli]
MARPTVHDAALRDRLLEVTADLVDRDGPARFSLRQVAAEAGTSTTAVYSLFGSKAELLSAVLDGAFASFGASQRAAAGAGLLGLGLAYREWALAHPALYRLMFGGALSAYADCTPDPEVADASMAPLRSAVAAGQASGELRDGLVEVVAVGIWGQVHGLVSLELAHMGPSDADWDVAYRAALESVRRGWAG